MSNRHARNRLNVAPAEITATDLDDRDDALLDAVVTAASLVACADGRIAPAERRLAIDFLADAGFLSTFTRAEILEAFDRRVRELEEEGGGRSAVESLARFAGLPPARLIVNAGQQVALADGHLSPHELHVLRLIRVALAAPDLPQRGRLRWSRAP